jgi:hypothetical protein
MRSLPWLLPSAGDDAVDDPAAEEHGHRRHGDGDDRRGLMIGAAPRGAPPSGEESVTVSDCVALVLSSTSGR